MIYPRKSLKRLRATQRTANAEIRARIETTSDQSVLKFEYEPKLRASIAPFRSWQVHRLYLYSGLPLQSSPVEHRLVARNGMKISSIKDVQTLAKLGGRSFGEFGKLYARN